MAHQDHDPWYVTAFGRFYPLLYAHRDDEAARREVQGLVRLLGSAGTGGRTLDLGCGTGRHAAALAEVGVDLVGLDLSLHLLEQAAGRTRLAGRLVRGDMRRLPFGASFGLVVNLFTSFGYFAAEADNQQALNEMARVLAPGGILVVDHLNRAHLARTLVPEDERMVEGLQVRQRREIRGDRIHKRIELRWPDGRERCIEESVRLYRADELACGLATAGLAQVEFFGSLSGAPYSDATARMVAVARRAP